MTAAACIRPWTSPYGIKALKQWHLGCILCELLTFPCLYKHTSYKYSYVIRLLPTPPNSVHIWKRKHTVSS